MNKRIAAFVAVALVVAIGLPLPAASEMISVSDAAVCTQDDVQQTCAQKSHVNAGVSYGIRTMMDVTYPPGCSECGPYTMNFEITKTLPTYVYPLRYLHLVPYAPHEEVRQVANSSVGISSCVDASSADNPSCGWTLDSAGKRIPDSQGFCSNRDLLDLKSCGTGTVSTWRGDELLGKTSSLADSYSTAYCLRQGNVFFEGYEIDMPRRNYEVKTYIKFEGVLHNTIIVSPSVPVYKLEAPVAPLGYGVEIQLIGEPSPRSAPDLSSYILYVPASPIDHPLVVDWQNNMLLVPRERVTIDGSECNKVGVSFAAFRKQGLVAPTTLAGDCLANQLFQLHQEDLALLTQNPLAETTYLVNGKKMFKPFSAGEQFARGLELQSQSPEVSFATVALTLDTATVVSVRPESIGYIKEAYAGTYGAMSKNGTLVAVIKNAGTLRTDYVVSVTDCQPGIVGAVPAQARTLDPNEEASIDFDIAASRNMDASHSCIVTLTAGTARKFDWVQVFFDTNKHVSKYARDLQLKNNDATLAN